MTLFDILGYKSFRMINYPRKNPLSLTLAITSKCNSRCRTCYIWKKNENGYELNIDEYGKIFQSFKKPIYELILTGGEPFLRDDIVEICRTANVYLKPKVIIIPTNGILTEKIAKDIDAILATSYKTKIIINISLDGIRQDNDEIRGLEGSFDKAIKTYLVLKEIRNVFLDLKVHTVISSYNVDKISKIYKYIKEVLKTNLFIIEVAQERAELNNQGRGKEVVPPLQKYLEAINLLSDRLEKEKFTGLSKMIQSFRLEYYQLTKHILEKKRQIIPCYAGFASAQIAPNGEVWFCPTKAKPVGNLRKSNYKFEKIWFSEKADELRRENNKGNCYCCLASIAYINMLYHFNSLLKVFIRFIKYNFKS